MERWMGRIESKLDSIVDNITGMKTDLEKHEERDDRMFSELDNRVRSNERKAWYGSGAAAGLAAIATFFFKSHG